MHPALCSPLVVAALALGQAPEGSGTPSSPVESAGSARAEIAAILSEESPASSAEARLAALGTEAVPELFDALRAHLAATDGGSEGVATPLLGALERMGRSAVLPVLELHAADDDAAARRAVLAVIAAIGQRPELALAAQAAAPGGFGPQKAPVLMFDFEQAAQAVLRRDPAANGSLTWLVGSIPIELGGGVVRAVAEAGDRRALESLVQLLGTVPDLDATILAHLGRSARNTVPPCPREAAAVVRGYLSSPRLDLARAALQAVGQLEDASAVEPCIELLDSPSEALAEGAHWALQRITGLGLPADSVRWASWYREELAWLENRAPMDFKILRTGSPVAQRVVLAQVARHRLDRHLLAREVACLLRSPDAQLRELACGAIEQLGSRSATSDLVELLSGPDPELANRAWRILRAWTGKDLPLDSPEWSSAAGGA